MRVNPIITLPMKNSSIEKLFRWRTLPSKNSSIEELFHQRTLWLKYSFVKHSYVIELFHWKNLIVKTSSVEELFRLWTLSSKISVKELFHNELFCRRTLSLKNSSIKKTLSSKNSSVKYSCFQNLMVNTGKSDRTWTWTDLKKQSGAFPSSHY